MKNAPFPKILSAWLIDMILFVISNRLFFYLFKTNNFFVNDIAAIVTLFSLWGMYVVLSIIISGNTIGQRFVGIRVLSVTGKKIKLYQALLRQIPLLTIVCGLTLFNFNEDQITKHILTKKQHLFEVALLLSFFLNNFFSISGICKKNLEDMLSKSITTYSFSN